MIRNFKRPMEPLIGTAGRVWKIGFSTRVPEKRTISTRTRLTVINLSRVSCSFEDNTVEFCLDVTKTRSETSGMTERGRKFS